MSSHFPISIRFEMGYWTHKMNNYKQWFNKPTLTYIYKHQTRERSRWQSQLGTSSIATQRRHMVGATTPARTSYDHWRFRLLIFLIIRFFYLYFATDLLYILYQEGSGVLLVGLVILLFLFFSTSECKELVSSKGSLLFNLYEMFH